MFSPLAKRCFTFALFALLTFPALGLDPMAELLKQRGEETIRRESKIEGPTAADVLFSNPEWRTQMAIRIAMAIEACRVNVQAENTRGVMGDAGRRQISALFSSLEMLQDPRIVPLIAPALRETSPGSDHGDSSLLPPQRIAGELLRGLAIRKVITVADPKQSWDSAGWGNWWQENKLNFDEVPEPLRAIDEGRFTKTLDPDMVSTPIKTPSAETLAKWEAEAQAKKEKEAQAVAASKATPDKPAPAVATVTRTSDTSAWFPIAAASAAILLAVGIWFYSRTSRA